MVATVLMLLPSVYNESYLFEHAFQVMRTDSVKSVEPTQERSSQGCGLETWNLNDPIMPILPSVLWLIKVIHEIGAHARLAASFSP
jgi:hypothetical protein